MKIDASKSPTFSLPLTPDLASMRARQCHHVWCIHCERAYPYGDFRQVGIRHLCPYTDCVGAAAFAWDWQRVRRVNANYPREPMRGVTYPLFGHGLHLLTPGRRH